ncbi:xanthine phosphoribosyltransferase, partial [Candidatus Roizmanbacteria bacterium]|nr:xanthine phosphoribosyltransferase [Candidatus Roizmanbacteria bacterium]
MQFHKVSWPQYERDCLSLAKKINHLKFDKIVAISRGGLLVARMMSDLLSTTISHITIESYRDLK